MMVKLNHFFVMTIWEKRSATTTKSKDELIMAIGVFNESEALMKITTFEIFSYYM